MTDLTGTVFGRLTVKARSASRWLDGPYVYYDCECVCGIKVPHVRSDTLRNGHTRSCGCLRRDMTVARFALRCAQA